MKKLVFIFILLIFILFIGCKDSTLSINGESSVLEGEQITLTINTNLDKYDAVWKSSNESVAVVNQYGSVTGLNAGTTLITLEAGGLKAEKIITVNEFVVEIDAKNVLVVGEETTLKVSHNSDELKEIFYSTSNETILTVNTDGVVKAVSRGTAKITVTISGIKKEVEIQVVKENSNPDVPKQPDDPDNPNQPDVPDNPNQPDDPEQPPVVIPIEINIPDYISYDEMIIATANREVFWSSSNENILYFNEMNEVIIVDMGIVTIRATDVNNPDAYLEKTVVVTSGVAPEKLKIYQSEGIYEVKLGANSSLILKVEVIGDKLFDGRVTWSVNKTDYATIDERGVLIPKKAGKVIVTVKSVLDENIEASIEITITK